MFERGARRAGAAALAACLLAAGCDDQPRDSVAVSGINLRSNYSPAMLRPGRLAVEPHNGPFASIDAAAVADLLTLPATLPQGLDMPQVAPGGWARFEHGRLLRFAVLFNPTGQISGDQLCEAQAPLTGGEGRPQGFNAKLALCLRGEAIAEGQVVADASDPPTPEFVRHALTKLLAAMLGTSEGE